MSTPPTPAKSPKSPIPNALGESPDERRIYAVMAYALPLIGGVIGLLVDGANPLTRAHARQSIGAALTLILAFFAWAVGGYIISLIPIAGPILAIAMFSLVIAMALFLAANWLLSLVMALRGTERAIPIANRVVARLFRSEAAQKNSA